MKYTYAERDVLKGEVWSDQKRASNSLLTSLFFENTDVGGG